MRAVQKFWKKLGPGFITGSSDDDPSGVATYATSGASFGFSMLWLSWATVPLMIAVQEMSARVGMVTGRGLIASMRRTVPLPLLQLSVLLLFVANSINIGADIGAMADAFVLIGVKIPLGLIALFLTVASVLLQIFVPYRTYVKYLKWLALCLLAYIAAAAYVTLPMREILVGTLVPRLSFDRETMLMITAILGTTISPYLMYWQASEEVEEEIAAGRRTREMRCGVTTHELKDMRFDVNFGMIFSNVVMFFIILTTAAVFFGSGVRIETAADAARALEPLAGAQAKLLFAFGIIGAGLLAVPVLAGSAAYAISELCTWRSGLFLRWQQARRFYSAVAMCTVLGLVVIGTGIPPMKALVWTAVLNGFVAPFTIVLLLIAGNSKKIMGDRVNSRWSNTGAVLTLVILVASIMGTVLL